MLKEKVLIIGMGISGSAVADYLKKQNIATICADDSLEKLHLFQKKGYEILKKGEAFPSDIHSCVCSPGIPLDHPLRKIVEEKAIPIIGEFQLGLMLLKNKKCYRCLGVTGTNGKTTTTLFAAHLLNHAGKTARAIGNVGDPVIAALDATEEVLVIEASSFQLAHLGKHNFFEAAVILNITPDHLDFHKSIEAYQEAKACMLDCVNVDNPVYIHEELRFVFPFKKCFVYSFLKNFVKTCLKKEGLLEGTYEHDIDNYAAALSIVSVILPISESVFCKAVKTFQKPEHRIEFVKDICNVHYVNDSKGTNLGAVVQAVYSISGPIILIAGGKGKNIDFSFWRSLFRSKIKAIFAIGESAADIYKALSPEYDVFCVHDLELAVKAAHDIAAQGETVLLSPGCSSFDQFNGYDHRGNCFKKLVTSLSKDEEDES
ncbi:UDP-N-acetylmuramoyl-L-alanine--D-glutamate ligase [Candidatus Clavichlamydia salmonicola]|uniref:UDP-N-acetylmuramoyl-L-alanine--D-glutamate ligase n=1 Tax=Candidatus Clavichlamydia salmonicola TaxID=469812 RepID=UPI0018914806|nr:UDP-N-acetylmuramoyl-L-alanine--D-glutamate ligase [Candidatus Clavichlamydia salmonicola]